MDLSVDLILQFSNKAAEITVLHVHTDDDASPAHAAIDQCRTLYHLHTGEIFQRHTRPIGRGNLKFADIFDTVAQRLRQTHDGLKASLSLVNFSRRFTGDRGLDHVVYIGSVDSVAGDGSPINVDREVLLPSDTINACILGTLNAAGDLRNLVRFADEHIEV